MNYAAMSMMATEKSDVDVTEYQESFYTYLGARRSVYIDDGSRSCHMTILQMVIIKPFMGQLLEC